MILLALILACGDDAPADTALCVRTPALDYEGFGRPLMDKHCTGCHSSLLREDQRNAAPVGVDLDSYLGVLTYAERLHVRVVEPEVATMPPGGGPTAEEIAQLEEWLVCTVYPDAERYFGDQEGSE